MGALLMMLRTLANMPEDDRRKLIVSTIDLAAAGIDAAANMLPPRARQSFYDLMRHVAAWE